jgi:hypothetical protein
MSKLDVQNRYEFVDMLIELYRLRLFSAHKFDGISRIPFGCNDLYVESVFEEISDLAAVKDILRIFHVLKRTRNKGIIHGLISKIGDVQNT